MKKVLTIPLILLILFSGISINVAAHYCGGMFIANKVSLSGKLASCGMEEQQNDITGYIFTRHSCENFVSTYTMNDNYVPSSIQAVDGGKYIINTLSFPLLNVPEIVSFTAISAISNRPPGIYDPRRVNREVICVFRI
jgi:hypothetical protein